MRKFKPRVPRSLPFRLLVILAGALLLLAAFAPSTNAQGLLRYYNFEGPPSGGYPVNLDSHFPAAEVGGGVFGLQLHGTGGIPGIPYPVGNTSSEAGLPDNIAPGDPGPNLASLGIHTSRASQLNLDMTFVSPTGVYDITSVSFAVNANGNGYLAARVEIRTRWSNFYHHLPRSAYSG